MEFELRSLLSRDSFKSILLGFTGSDAQKLSALEQLSTIFLYGEEVRLEA